MSPIKKGRRPTPAADKLGPPLWVRLKPAAERKLRAAARQDGLPLATFLRQKITEIVKGL